MRKVTRQRSLACGRWFARCTEGSAAIEFGLLGPLLALLLLGLVDVGNYAYQRLDMFSAARSGTQYFMSGGADHGEARSIIESSWTGSPEDAAVALDRFCLCGSVEAACNALCPHGQQPDAFTRIRLSATFRGIVTSFTSEASDVARIR